MPAANENHPVSYKNNSNDEKVGILVFLSFTYTASDVHSNKTGRNLKLPTPPASATV